MHINNHPIPLLTIHNSGNNNQLILHDEVANAPLVLAAGSEEVEFQGGRELHEQQEREAQDGPQGEVCGPHCGLNLQWGRYFIWREWRWGGSKGGDGKTAGRE